ncbi:fasciclin domain-containing protein, partial [Mesotoga prima]
MMRNLIFVILILSSVISLGQEDILKTINETEELSIVASYIQLSGLDQTLSGKGPFTFFAPTDDAFMKLPELTRANLINDVVRLQRVLKYHIIQG